MNNEQQIDRFSSLIERSATDTELRGRLLADPRSTLQAEGLALPEGVNVVALENTDAVMNLVIPHVPATGELSDAELEDVNGGFGLIVSMSIIAASFVVGGLAAGGAGIGIGVGAGKGLLKSRR